MQVRSHPGFAFSRAGAASMVYGLREHRRTRMLRLLEAYALG